jgi:hypothetical protein
MPGEFITIQELAEQLNCCEASIKRMVGRGELPPFSTGAADGKVKAWHKDRLREHDLRRYEEQFDEYQRRYGKVKQSVLPPRCAGRT